VLSSQGAEPATLSQVTKEEKKEKWKKRSRSAEKSKCFLNTLNSERIYLRRIKKKVINIFPSFHLKKNAIIYYFYLFILFRCILAWCLTWGVSFFVSEWMVPLFAMDSALPDLNRAPELEDDELRSLDRHSFNQDFSDLSRRVALLLKEKEELKRLVHLLKEEQ
jgi:hypothetical protein